MIKAKAKTRRLRPKPRLKTGSENYIFAIVCPLLGGSLEAQRQGCTGMEL